MGSNWNIEKGKVQVKGNKSLLIILVIENNNVDVKRVDFYYWILGTRKGQVNGEVLCVQTGYLRMNIEIVLYID